MRETTSTPLTTKYKRSSYHRTGDSCHLVLGDKDLFELLVVKTARERNMFTLVLSADAGSSLKYAEWDLINPYLIYIYIRLIDT